VCVFVFGTHMQSLVCGCVCVCVWLCVVLGGVAEGVCVGRGERCYFGRSLHGPLCAATVDMGDGGWEEGRGRGIR
jgi:hypothetical protein